MYYPGCTIAAKYDPIAKSYILGSNSDNPPNARTKVTVRHGERFRFVGTQLICGDEQLDWEHMITRGVNEKGLAYTFAYVDISETVKTEKHSKIHFKYFGDAILGNCSNLQDVNSYLNSSNPTPHGNFLFADSHGNVDLYELTPGQEAQPVAEPQDIVRTNHYIIDGSHETDYPQKSQSHSRYEAAKATLLRENHAGSKSQAALTAMLTCHFSPSGRPGGATCNHGPDFGTVSSELIDPSAKRLSYHYGPACGQQTLPDTWPNYQHFDLSKIETNFTGDLTTVDGQLLYES